MSIESYCLPYNAVVLPRIAWSTLSEATPLRRYALNGATMGTRYSAIFYAAAGADIDAIDKGLRAAVDLVDNQMSSWKPGSDLCRFNGAAPMTWIDIPPEFAAIIGASLDIGRASGGAFDIGVGDLVDAWGFGPAGKEPDATRIAAASGTARPPLAEILELDRAAPRLLKRGPVQLDLSGIAKGFGVDRLAASLDAFGIDSYLVSIDGEVRARGIKPDGKAWNVAVERPHDRIRDVARVVALTDCAIATSGDYRHRAEFGDISASHTMNPVNRRPLANRLASVTVIASDCMQADAWATAFMVLGEDEGPEIAERLGIEALFILRSGEHLLELPIGQRWDD
jgi:thiamine biosynthesis lipoprotein